MRLCRIKEQGISKKAASNLVELYVNLINLPARIELVSIYGNITPLVSLTELKRIRLLQVHADLSQDQSMGTALSILTKCRRSELTCHAAAFEAHVSRLVVEGNKRR